MIRMMMWVAAAALLQGVCFSPASAQSAPSKGARYDCRERLYALSPTDEDRAATAQVRAALERGEIPAEAKFLTFEDIAQIRNGSATLMQVYIVDFLRSPADSIEFEVGGKRHRFTLQSYTAGMTVLVGPQSRPIQVHVRSDFHCAGKPWPVR